MVTFTQLPNYVKNIVSYIFETVISCIAEKHCWSVHVKSFESFGCII